MNCLRVFLAALSKVKFIWKASSSLMKEQVSRLTKSAGLISSLISSHLATRVKDWPRGLRRKDWILRALFLAVTSLCPQKVGSRDEIYRAKWKLMLISDQAKDLDKKLCGRWGLYVHLFNRWFTSGILNKSTGWVEKSFHTTMYVEKARVFRSNITMFRSC